MSTGWSNKIGNTLYGTSEFGSTFVGELPQGLGTIFSLDADDGDNLNVLHFFPNEYNRPEGFGPRGKLIYKNNYLYGTTKEGGYQGAIFIDGAFFKLNLSNLDLTYTGAGHWYEYCNGIVWDPTLERFWFTSTRDNFTISNRTYMIGSLGNITQTFNNKNIVNHWGYTENYVWHHEDGVYPWGHIFLNARSIYGITESGGDEGYGTIWRYDITDETSGNCVKLVDCGYGSFSGKKPKGGFDYIRNDSLWGTTSEGGNFELGTIYSINNGSTPKVQYNICNIDQIFQVEGDLVCYDRSIDYRHCLLGIGQGDPNKDDNKKASLFIYNSYTNQVENFWVFDNAETNGIWHLSGSLLYEPNSDCAYGTFTNGRNEETGFFPTTLETGYGWGGVYKIILPTLPSASNLYVTDIVYNDESLDCSANAIAFFLDGGLNLEYGFIYMVDHPSEPVPPLFDINTEGVLSVSNSVLKNSISQQHNINIEGLAPSSAYRIRAYARNIIGKYVYSEEYVFWTPAAEGITFVPGWNSVSSYIDLSGINFEDLIEPISSNILQAHDEGSEHVYNPSQNLHQITNWDITKGYYFYATQACSLNIVGRLIDPDSTPITIDGSTWYNVAYLRTSSLPIDEALTSILNYGLIAKDGQGNVYWPDFEIEDLSQMDPGYGYEVYLDCTGSYDLIYPSNETNYRVTVNNTNTTTQRPEYLIPPVNTTGNSAILLLQTTTIPENWEVGVWNSEWTLVGSGKVHSGKVIITIWGDNELSLEKDGAIENENLIIKAYDFQNGIIKDVRVNNLYEITMKQNESNFIYKKNNINKANISIDSNINSYYNLAAAPNPFQDNTTITYHLSNQNQVSLSICDQLGNEISNLINSQVQDAGNYSYQFSPNDNLTNGIYTCKLTVNDYIESIQIMIIR